MIIFTFNVSNKNSSKCNVMLLFLSLEICFKEVCIENYTITNFLSLLKLQRWDVFWEKKFKEKKIFIISIADNQCSYVIGVKTVEVLLAGKGLLLIWLNLLIRAESFLSCSAKFSDSKSLARSSSISVMYFVTMAVMSFSLVSPVLLSFIQLPTLKRNTKNKNLKNKINSNLNT